MKNLIKLFSFAALIAFFVTSCDTDPCKDVVCGTFGACTEGLCICDTGYEQDSAGLCNNEVRAKFVGSWTVSDNCTSSGTASYAITITSATSGILNVGITNFWDLFTNQVTATVSGTTITIDRQEPDSDLYFVEGTGTISGNTITITYTVTDETDPQNILTDTCTSSFVK